jgi:hypothetical protein
VVRQEYLYILWMATAGFGSWGIEAEDGVNKEAVDFTGWCGQGFTLGVGAGIVEVRRMELGLKKPSTTPEKRIRGISWLALSSWTKLLFGRDDTFPKPTVEGELFVSCERWISVGIDMEGGDPPTTILPAQMPVKNVEEIWVVFPLDFNTT